MERLSPDEVCDWRSSQRLRDYVARMEAKEQAAKAAAASAAATVNSSRRLNTAADEVICLSSDSEDEVTEIPSKQDHVFRCHQCDMQLSCGNSFHSLMCDHYRTCHGIDNIDIVRIVQPDGSESMQVVHLPPASTGSPRSSPASNSLSVGPSTSSSPAPPHGSSSYLQRPTLSQSRRYLVSRPVPDQTAWNSSAANAITGRMQAASGDTDPAPSRPYSHMLKQLTQNIQSRESTPRQVLLLRRLSCRNSALLNGDRMCRGDGATSQSSCDADVICLD